MTIANVGAAVAQKVGSSTPPSSISMLVLGGGIFMLMMGVTGGTKYKLPKFSVTPWSGGGDMGTDYGAGGGGGSGADGGSGSSTGGSGSVTPSGTASWVWPLTSMEITQAFKGLTTGEQYIAGQHRGEDYRAKFGTAAYSVANATVVGVTKGGLTRVGPGTFPGTFNTAYGPNSVELLTDSGYSVVYGHFSDVAVRVGQKVRAGELLGHTGSSSGYFGSGDHLHIEVTKRINGVVQWFRTSVLMKGAQNPANVQTDTTTGGVREY